MRSAAVLALLLCAGQVMALPVNGPMTKFDDELMKCFVEVISDTLANPGPRPVSPKCSKTLRADERILSMLRHQNLLNELQDLAPQGATERARPEKKHSTLEEELSKFLERQKDQQNDQAELREGTEETPSQDAEKRADSPEAEKSGEDTDRAGPQASPELGQGPKDEEDNQVPEEEGDAITHPPASLPSQKQPGPPPEGGSEGPSQGVGNREEGQDAERGQQARREDEEDDDDEEEEAGEKVLSEEEGPTEAADPHPSLGYKEVRRAKSWSKDGAGEPGAEEAQAPEGQGDPESGPEEEMAGAPRGLLRGGKSREPEPEDERLSKEWEDAKRWSKMDQLAKELTADKRQEGEDEDDPDRSMRLSFRPRGYGFGGPGPQLRRGWRPSSQEDPEGGLAPQGRSYPEEKKEEEGSANRRPEDQELESLSAIEAELEKVSRQLQALQRG
ncbi:chromogranin-A [Pipistrellus kuhlii]|uniref:Chromogranin-A n=1 Tax=Pipistrellus kuhlii TaxID=59472 RepID=A0A7J7SFP7_PIPKU|nr:chromogranin-A [Pipistrellus kuhlii]KAF6287209.1 chromogranin A [Pipistrellus kuhlii]